MIGHKDKGLLRPRKGLATHVSPGNLPALVVLCCLDGSLDFLERTDGGDEADTLPTLRRKVQILQVTTHHTNKNHDKKGSTVPRSLEVVRRMFGSFFGAGVSVLQA